MSSEQERPAPPPARRPGSRRAAAASAAPDTPKTPEIPEASAVGAAELGRALGYDPDDPATWPGNWAEPGELPAGTAEPSPEAAVPTRPTADPSDGDTQNLTDPKAIRALAHPVRMALLELLAVHPTLTATQASEALGESPANCAFHLRTLAKYGFVREAGGGRGRERPWTIVHRSVSVSAGSLDDRQARVAAEALEGVWLDRWLGNIRRAVAGRSWPPEWEDAALASQSLVFLTAEETAQIGSEIRAILGRYLDRRTDPSTRPPGSLPVEFTAFGYPREDLSGPPTDKETRG
jgi:DNA-binding transcriptional ArsR family regulator